jgi:hypothetical protein
MLLKNEHMLLLLEENFVLCTIPHTFDFKLINACDFLNLFLFSYSIKIICTVYNSKTFVFKFNGFDFGILAFI